MKKVERINTIIRYINNRAHFTISEIMEEFNISRSTAIRDIQEIEAMGVPLTAEVGRSGGYDVMKNSILPAIHFTDNEVKALFVALLATKNQQLPFLKSRITLTEKLIGLLTVIQQENLILLNEVLMFEGTNQANPDLLDMSDIPHPILEKLIQSILVDRYLKLTLINGIFPVYLRHLYHENGQWFIDAFDFSGSVNRTFPVAQLEDVKINEEKNTTRLRQIMTASAHEKTAYNVVLELGPKAVSQYKKYHPFNVKMAYTNPFQLSGICKLNIDISNREEIESTANWLRFLGIDLKVVNLTKEIESQLMENPFL